jgi:hypothetical protein
MNGTRHTRFLFCILACTTNAVVAESSLDNLSYYGANTLRYSQYEASGLTAAGPYPFEGDMYFDEFNIYLDGYNSDYDRWRGEVSGVADIDDRYRSTHNGFVPERINLTRENGEGVIPYRAEIGDLFSYYSYLSLQRSLKGLQLELQPVSGNPDRRYSVVLTAGAEESSWRNLTFQDNFSSGASLLVQDAILGALNLNVVYNYRDNSHRLGTLDRSQIVVTLAGEKGFAIGSQSLLFESEIAYFNGDHDGLSGARSGQDRSENGYFLQLSGRSQQLPWDYRFRYEQYGQDFRPTGAIVSFDRRSMEAHTGWRFKSGLRLRGRAQLFEDGFESINTTRTRTYGANLSGPVLQNLALGITARADAFVQITDDDARTLGRHTKNLDISITAPLRGGWITRTGLFFQNLDDEVNLGGDLFTRQLTVNADHGFTYAGFSGTVTPGVLARTLRRGSNFSTDVFPTLAVSANQGPHNLRVNYGSQFNNRKLIVSGPDIDTHTLNADYRYTHRQHEFGFEGSFFNRDPSPGEHTDAWRVSVFWTWSFDKAPGTVAAAPVVSDTSLDGNVIELLILPLGSGRGTVLRALERNSIGGGAEVSGFMVYEYPVLENIFQRQRYATSIDADELQRMILIIDFDDIGNRDSVFQTFERVRQTLIRQFGTPTRTIEEGEMSDTFMADVNGQRLIRIVEWKTGSGTLRFGIPRRLDGQVRMEVQHAASFPQPRETLWSIETLR